LLSYCSLFLVGLSLVSSIQFKQGGGKIERNGQVIQEWVQLIMVSNLN